MPSDIAEAYQHCMHIAREHYENFPVVSRLVRADLRPAVAAIYAFARHADDLADEGDIPPETRLKQLDAWETLLNRCISEPVDHPVFIALGDAIRRHRLPPDPLFDLLVAFRMDVSIHHYETTQELEFYCKHSANPVGRLILALHGIKKREAMHYSDALCTGLQLTNFWQDLSVDLQRGRHYLPAAWLQHSTEKHIPLDNAAVQPALKRAISWTDHFFCKGQQLLPLLPFRLRLQIAATLHGGRKILQRVAVNDSPLQQRPALKRSDWFAMVPTILFDALFAFRFKRKS